MHLSALFGRMGRARSKITHRSFKLQAFVALAVGTFLAACAAAINMQPAPLQTPTEQNTGVVRLATEVRGVSNSGYSRTLRIGTQWQQIGDTNQGQVLKPLDSVLTVEGANVREAYVVIRDGSWVGFWLPVERAYSPLRTPVAATFEKVQQ
jgi:hypothetical protein